MGIFAQLNHGITGGAGHDLVGQFGHGVLNLRVVEPPAHESLHREQSVLWVGYSLPLGDLADITFTGFGIQRNDRRGYPTAFSVLHNHGFPGFNDCRDRVRCSEVDSQDFSHLFLLNSHTLVTI